MLVAGKHNDGNSLRDFVNAVVSGDDELDAFFPRLHGEVLVVDLVCDRDGTVFWVNGECFIELRNVLDAIRDTGARVRIFRENRPD